MTHVPLAGPTEVALPVDPLETLSQKWDLSKLDLYEERWKVGESEILAYLRRQLACAPCRTGMAEQHWRSAADGESSLLVA